MARSFSIAAAVVAASIGAAGSAAWGADPAVNFAGSGSTFAGDCRGQDASLAGSNNTATIRGACRAFQIAGDGNRVLVDMANQRHDQGLRQHQPGQLDRRRRGPGHHRRTRQHGDPRPLDTRTFRQAGTPRHSRKIVDARTCAGHPRAPDERQRPASVDGRDKPGHDGNRLVRRSTSRRRYARNPRRR